MSFIFFISFVILLRLIELIHSKRNEKWLLQHGAIEYGKEHYPFIVALHTLFFISLMVEYFYKIPMLYSQWLMAAYFFLIILKIWVVVSLGKFWNTKIYRIQNFLLVEKGPYRYFKHPNYIIVILEIAIIPLIFHLYFTAIVFSLLNAIMLFVRIKEENKILKN